MNKTIAVTGASGYLGNVVVKKLISRGYHVRALIYNQEKSLEGLEIEKVYGTLGDVASLQKLCQGCDGVFHVASYVSILGNEHARLKKINIEGTQNIIDICKELQLRMVYVSSVEAIGKQGSHIHTEEDGFDEHASLIPYGWSKAIASKRVQEACAQGLDAVTICPAGICGPYDYGTSKIGLMVKQFVAHTLPGYPSQGGFCFVDVRDVADAIIKAYTDAKTGAYYLVSAEYAEVSQLMSILEEVSNIRKPKIAIPLWIIFLVAGIIDPFCTLFRLNPIFTKGSVNILKSRLRIESKFLEKDLNIVPRSLHASLADQVRWYNNEEVDI